MYLQASEVSSRTRRYNEKVDIFSLIVMMAEIVTSYMMPTPRRFVADHVMDMVDIAIEFMEPLCSPMVPLLRSGFSDVPTERPSAHDMLSVLNSPDVLACAATGTLVCVPQGT